MEHKWQIRGLVRKTAGDVVCRVNYVCKSTFENHDEIHLGNLKITGSSDTPGFINFEDLTKDEVLAWVTSSIDYQSIQNENSSSISKTIIQKAIIPPKKSGIPKSWRDGIF